MCRSDLFTEAGSLLWLYSTFKLELCEPTTHKTTQGDYELITHHKQSKH